MEDDKIYHIVWQAIEPYFTGTLQQNFTNCKSHAEKFQIVGAMLEDHNLMELIDQHTPPEPKNNAKASEYRLEGNKIMKAGGGPRRKLLDAAEFYNRALAYAVDGSDEMAKAYGNRSAVCHALQEYALGLDNIEMARTKGTCGEELLKRLDARKDACNENLRNSRPKEPAYFEATIGERGNPTIPRIVEGVTLKKNEELGRHLVATQDFDVGDILMIDEPYCVGTNGRPAEDYKRCNHCLRMRILQLQPCSGCVEVMFCSTECAIAAWTYHKIECKILKKLWQVHERFLMNAPRIVCMAISAFNDDLERLESHIEKIDPDFTAFQLDWNTISPEQMYDAIHILSTNEDKRVPMTEINIAVRAYLMAETMLRHSPELKRVATDEKKRNLIRSLVYHHSMSAYVNMRFRNLDNGLAAFPLLSMINHCCIGNTVCLPIAGSRKAIIACRPIKAGDQIVYVYSACSSSFDRHSRRNYLREHYQFRCRCEACLADYPIIPSTPRTLNAQYTPEDVRTLDRIQDYMEAEEGQSAPFNAELFTQMNRMMKEYNHHMPTKCIRRVSSLWSDCLSALYNEKSLEQKYEKFSSF